MKRARTLLLDERHAQIAIVCELLGHCPECREPVRHVLGLCELSAVCLAPCLNTTSWLQHLLGCSLAEATFRGTP
jgi:hypothetical protein